jgi:hypothetical protein
MMGMNTSQPAQSPLVPMSMALQSPEQVASPPGPSASSVQQPAITVSEVLAPTTAPPAPTAPGAQPTTSDTVTSTSSDLPERLWDRAYNELKGEEDKWVDEYERILSRELMGGDSSSTNLELQKNKIEQKNPAKRQQQMSQLVEAGLRKTAGEDKVKQVIGGAMLGILNVKDMIGSALQPVPQAALAWTGVCFALQVSLLPENCNNACRFVYRYSQTPQRRRKLIAKGSPMSPSGWTGIVNCRDCSSRRTESMVDPPRPCDLN